MALLGDRMRPTLRDLLRIVFSYKKLIVFCFLAITISVAVASVLMKPVYEASVKVQAQQTFRDNPVNRDYVDPRIARLAFLQAQVEVIRSDTVVERAVASLPGYDRQVSAAVWRAVQSNVSVASPKGFDFTGSDILIVSVRDHNPKRAQQLANAIAQTYRDRSAELRASNVTNVIKNLAEEREKIARRVDVILNQIDSFRKKAGSDVKYLTSNPDFKGNPQLAEYNSNFLRARTLLAEVKAYLDEAQRNLQSGMIPYKMLAGNPALLKIKDNLTLLQAQLARLRAQYTDRYPQVLIIKREIESNKSQLMEAVRQDLRSRRVDMAALAARTAALQRIVDRLTRIENKQFQYSRLLKKYATEQEAQQTLTRNLNKLSVARLLDQKKDINIRILDPAQLPKVPVKPKRTLYTLLGAIFGLMLGLGLAFWLDFMDHTFKTVEEVEFYLDLPVLGVTPKTSRM
jgi:succinoglycan biosynthesis transport protein ExoP